MSTTTNTNTQKYQITATSIKMIMNINDRYNYQQQQRKTSEMYLPTTSTTSTTTTTSYWYHWHWTTSLSVLESQVHINGTVPTVLFRWTSLHVVITLSLFQNFARRFFAVQAVSVPWRKRKGSSSHSGRFTAPAQHEVRTRGSQRDARAHSHQAGGLSRSAERVQSGGHAQ